MHVTEDLDGRLQIEQHALRHEDFHRFINEELDRLLVEFDGLAPRAIFHFNQLLDDHVNDGEDVDDDVDDGEDVDDSQESIGDRQ